MLYGWKKILIIAMTCMLPCTDIYAGSILLKKAQQTMEKLLPNPMEIGWVADTVNILWRVGELAVTTVAMVKKYQESYEKLMEAKEKIESAYKNIDYLFKNFDPYTLDSWSSTLRGAQNVINYDCYGALYAFAAAEFVVPATQFIFDADSMFNYDYRLRKNRESIRDIYYNRDLDSIRRATANMVGSYATERIVELDNMIAQQREIINNPLSTDEQISRATEEIAKLDMKVQEFMSGPYNGSELNHEDSLLSFVHNMIIYNLTVIQNMEEKVVDLENAAENLVEQWYDLKKGVSQQRTDAQRTKITEVDSTRQKVTNDDKYFGDGPNVVPRPEERMRRTDSSGLARLRRNSKKAVSYHDIRHLQNGIDFVSLRQEMYLRDITVLKAKSLAVLVAAEAYDGNSSVMERIFTATAFEKED